MKWPVGVTGKAIKKVVFQGYYSLQEAKQLCELWELGP